MSSPYIGEIRLFGGNFAPSGWAFCNGALIPIAENEALFQLIGTTYGGDGQETFALPNLQSRFPIHMGTGPFGDPYQIAQMAGTEEETLTVNQTPVHTHPLIASEGAADQVTVSGNLPAEATKRFYITPGTLSAMGASAIVPAGGSQPHENIQPFLAISFIISLYGIFPSQT